MLIDLAALVIVIWGVVWLIGFIVELLDLFSWPSLKPSPPPCLE